MHSGYWLNGARIPLSLSLSHTHIYVYHFYINIPKACGENVHIYIVGQWSNNHYFLFPWKKWCFNEKKKQRVTNKFVKAKLIYVFIWCINIFINSIILLKVSKFLSRVELQEPFKIYIYIYIQPRKCSG